MLVIHVRGDVARAEVATCISPASLVRLSVSIPPATAHPVRVGTFSLMIFADEIVGIAHVVGSCQLSRDGTRDGQIDALLV